MKWINITFKKESYIKKDAWFFIIPSIGIGYYKKFLSISLYLIVC